MRLLVTILVVLLIGIAAWAMVGRNGAGAEQPTVVVTRGTIVRKAVAAGQVEPAQETQVNTQLAGFVRKLHAELGQKVAAGDAICEVWPALTEQDLLRAERGLQQAVEGEQAAKEFVDGEHVLAGLTRFLQGERNLERMQRSAERGRRSAEETLRLLREGKVEIDGRVIDFVVRAPVGGHVLQVVRQGDPVTPASSYGLGTVIAVLGDLEQPVFRGTVDEIDIGRLRVGMAAKLTVGALPGVELAGTVKELGLRARRQDNAALFDVRIAVTPLSGVLLRAGYSAVAEVEIARADDVVVVPERCVAQRAGAAFVSVADGSGGVRERQIELGLGDGLQVAVTSGLSAGERILDRAPR
jgi:HlyD family secretion protein